jgi:hypothetical protein
MGGGSKLIFSSSLKSVIGEVMKHPVTTEDNIEVDAITGFKGVNNRLIMSPIVENVIAAISADTLKYWWVFGADTSCVTAHTRYTIEIA